MNLLTTASAAKELGVSRTRVQQFIGTGRLPSIKLGRDHVIKQSDLKKVRNRKNGAPFKKKEAKL